MKLSALDTITLEEELAIIEQELEGGKKLLADTTKPQAFITQIPLVDVFERLKRVKADAWQKDFCNRLQEATENRHETGVRALVHAQPQLGKSVILAQIFAVWLFMHHPLHRFALATYNIKRSQRHANVVIRLMQSPEFKDLAPNADCYLPNIVSPDNFFTNARKELNDGQASFNPMGLQSGFVGSGADTLAIDDPYKSAEEAMSETIRENIEVFWDETANVRLTEFANVFGMFHRYHQADLAGFLLATGEFDYWRYASEADGVYIDDETGLVYPDPMNREIGEYISPRFSNHYYEKQKRNSKTWYSQFQGKPTGEEGTSFNVKKIHFLDPVEDVAQIDQIRAECVHWARAWDNAATKKDTSAYSVGVRGGITLDERILIDSIIRERFNTAERYDAQLDAAELDGYLTPVLIPNDPGSAGTDTAFQTQQMLEAENYTCIAEVVSGSKEVRAQPLSLAVNSGKCYVALPEAQRKEFKKEYKFFPLSTFKDQVDAGSDLYRYLYRLLKKGTVIKNYSEPRNLVDWDTFAVKYGATVPAHWKIYAGCRISEDGSKPSGAVIVAHAAENSGLKDTLFVIDAYKQSSGDYYALFSWINKTLALYGIRNKPLIVMNGTETIAQTAQIKLKEKIFLFDGSNTDGTSEMNWYFLPRIESHPFNAGEKATGIYYLIRNSDDLLSVRQESVMWKFNDKGEPQEFGGIILDALRMVVHNFQTRALPLTAYEKDELKLPPTLQFEVIQQDYENNLISGIERAKRLNVRTAISGIQAQIAALENKSKQKISRR